MALGAFSPSLVKGRRQQADVSLAAFSSGWLNREPKGAKMSAM